MSDTLKSLLTARSTGYCARYCGPITTTGCSAGGYVLIAGTGLNGACPVAIITETKYYSKKKTERKIAKFLYYAGLDVRIL